MRSLSPLVASVLLIAFVVSTSLLTLGWLSKFLSNATETTGLKTQLALSCQQASARIERIHINYQANSTSVLVINDGFANLQGKVSVFSKAGESCESSYFSLNKGEAKSIKIANCSFRCSDLDRVILTTNCAGIGDSKTMSKEATYFLFDGYDCSELKKIKERLSSSSNENLVLYLKFDEGSGTVAYDSSGYGNNGTLYDANATNDDGDTPPQWVDGKFGKALSFDGVDDYVEVPDSASLNFGAGSFTVIEWIKVNLPWTSEGYITSKAIAPGWYRRVEADGRLVCRFHDGSNMVDIYSDVSVADGNWHHVAFVIDRSAQKGYWIVDGVKQTECDISTENWILLRG